MHLPLFPEWSSFDDSERIAVAREIQEAEPGFTFVELQTYTQNVETNRLPFFHHLEPDGRKTAFVYLPGESEVLIGFDISAWKPSDVVLRWYEKTAEWFGIEETIFEEVASRTSDIRTISRPSALVEVASRLLDPLRAIDKFLPRLQVPIRSAFEFTPVADVAFEDFVNSCRGDLLHVEDQGVGSAYAVLKPDWVGEVTRHFEADGFRLPTWDEWESLCAGGTSTLFRWGDSCDPERGFPSGRSHHDRHFGRLRR